MTLKRKAPLRRTLPASRGRTPKVFSSFSAPRKPLKKSNPEATAKRKKRQRSKHAKYMASQTRKDVEQRSGGRCEVALRLRAALIVKRSAPNYDGWVWMISHKDREVWIRCPSRATDHHHKTYARYGGQELPEDMVHACEVCHAALEAEHPTRRR